MTIRILWSCFRGVPIFFMLSGFLLWQSLDRDSNFKEYCKKRVLRLYPELWGGIMVNALVMLTVYRTSIAVIPFIAHIICQGTILQFWTPDSLRGYGCGVPNGSLWTIGVMVQSYLVFYFVWKLLKKSALKVQLSVLAVALMCNFLPELVNVFFPSIIAKLFGQTFVPYFWMFLFGGLMAANYERLIELLKKWWFALFLFSAIISISGIEAGMGAYEMVKSLTFGGAMVGFAYRFPNFKIKRDYSYGLYIYHMIVINLMIHLRFYGKIVYIAVALVLSAILAVGSQWIASRVERFVKNSSAKINTHIYTVRRKK